jgi:NAD(P)-dependent dehydrogenase (short-subunit alcohol dehydrogenase family)
VDQLAGGVAVVTGAASGIGRALAERVAAEGMRVAVADVEAEPLAVVAASLRAGGAEVLDATVDVSDADAVERFAAAVNERFGAVDVLCNNAGVAGGGPAWALTLDDWRWVLDVNLWGVIHGVRAFVPAMVERGRGHVVNTASMAGLSAAPFLGAYAASKWAVVGLTETMYHELAMVAPGVGVSVLCPAWVSTRIHESGRNRPGHFAETWRPGGDPEMPSPVADAVRAGKDPADVAAAVVDAIRERRLWILTHPEAVGVLADRSEALLSGRNPELRVPPTTEPGDR